MARLQPLAIDHKRTLSPTWRRLLMACAMVSLAWALLARLLGPSDAWDQTQPKTVSYTTDIIIHGGSHWILPVERGEWPATKPPLYNWLAVPGVKVLGFSSELAHKLPSVVSLCVCWLIVVRLGRSLGRRLGARMGGDESLGWLAGMILPANYTMFKLGYLARPDMLLTLWLLLAWLAATALAIDSRRERSGANIEQARPPLPGGVGEGLGVRVRTEANSDPLAPSPQPFPRGRGSQADRGRQLLLVGGFWLCVTLAGLTKGPAALVAVTYAIVAGRVIGGSWRAIGIYTWWAGIPFSALIVGAWAYAAWRIDPDHVRIVMWHDEIVGRVTGYGPEGNRHGPSGWLKTFPELLLYYLIRFLPWSFYSIAAAVVLWKGRTKKKGDQSEKNDEARLWLVAAAIQAATVIALFTLSVGKRADYIAAAFPPGAILAAWWLLRVSPRIGAAMPIGIARPWLAPATAAVLLAVMTVVNARQPAAPDRQFSRDVEAFIEAAAARMDAEPLPAGFWGVGNSHVQAFLGSSQVEGGKAVRQLTAAGRPCYVVAGWQQDKPATFADWLNRRPELNAHAELVVESRPLATQHNWPEQLMLYRVTPGRAAE